ncbi:tautomerase family protein [Variovorax paradoxus]|uniref:tautomerase family protein n=1 Tax=Variovorax paradoxus TaxID=34073 RepID=UPI002785034C|nr:tautomerase family protein [Variovorax paradoxus]MDQ0587884.1 4-oxalocrotonate tautomerase [Variovorax paradoxus]
MPEIHVYLGALFDNEQKKSMMREVSNAVIRTLDVKIENVIVQIVEASLDDKMKGGESSGSGRRGSGNDARAL